MSPRGIKPAPATSAPLEPGALVSAATEPAQSGDPHIESPVAYDGILLASFGGPEGQDDVLPFLRNVTRGRGIPDERLEEVAVHYRHHGGVSPINDQNRELKMALEAELARRGVDLPVFWGNRNWNPYLNDALHEAYAAGCTKLIALATSAYSSYSSCRQYREDFADALEDTGLQGVVQVDKVRQFFDHPGFVTPFIDGLRDDLASLLAADETLALADVEVLFTTHSVPTDDALRSGARDVDYGEGGAYAAQHLAVAEVVAVSALRSLAERDDVVARGLPDRLNSQLVYQSRSGPPTQPWLEPDINDVIEGLPSHGRRAVVVVPIGFVSDHMEVLWDLDNEAKQSAAEAGLAFRRSATPGVHASYVAGLVDLVLERRDGVPVSERPALTQLGPWFDVCRPGCCENVRLGFKPATAGLQP
ncbi:ferrochelatase [Pseudoclavibacter endophyticus]|uniref:Coproporphyrin III ferrochelatase n=1 Tax=Pseudoclavibacter endophyticus TaxID=1778590 RepID=A0A6H9WR47_9MICO|nr:ferrochelatase [Pseudoclavibacter endophyticus]KAB1648800.1 ferrochelatase [Pseudoclavibacter endophyticus]GGA68424.1 ferrochelatase [Pseudoclavibacter endophyticus]